MISDQDLKAPFVTTLLCLLHSNQRTKILWAMYRMVYSTPFQNYIFANPQIKISLAFETMMQLKNIFEFRLY